MKLCFHHEPFDVDVSSGTDHAAYQWMELALAFGVTDMAVINLTDDSYPSVSSDLLPLVFSDMRHFTDHIAGESVVMVDNQPMAIDYRAKQLRDAWYVFGGASGLDYADIMIPTHGNRSLYPREAAAIILAHYT